MSRARVAVRHHVAHPHRGTDDLGIAAQVDHPAAAIERRQHGRDAGRQFARDVVLDHPQPVALGQLQDTEGVGHADAGARRVLQGGVDEQRARPVLRRGLLQRLAIQPVQRARHRHHPQPGQAQHLQQVGVGRLLDQHGIARTQQRADHHVEPVRHALGQQHLRHLHFHALGAERGGDGLAQRRVTIGMAVVGDAHGRHPAHVAQRHVQPFFIEPFARQPAAARLDGDGVVREDVRQQPGGVQPRRLPGLRLAPARRRVGRGHAVAGARARGQPAQRNQAAVGAGHGKGADLVLAREVAHRG